MKRALFQIHLEPSLLEMDWLLEDPKLLLQVTNDLAQSAPRALSNGRPSTPSEVTLRMSVVRRVMGWSYEKAYQEIDGSLKWRWFCRLHAQPVPSDSTQQEREALIRPETLQRLNQRLLHTAQAHGVTQGRKLRTEGTVIETNIHYPTDSGLLIDSARILGRLLAQARKLLRPQETADKKAVPEPCTPGQAFGAADWTAIAHEAGTKTAGKQGVTNLSSIAQGGAVVAGPSGTPLARRWPEMRRAVGREFGSLCAVGPTGDRPDYPAGAAG